MNHSIVFCWIIVFVVSYLFCDSDMFLCFLCFCCFLMLPVMLASPWWSLRILYRSSNSWTVQGNENQWTSYVLFNHVLICWMMTVDAMHLLQPSYFYLRQEFLDIHPAWLRMPNTHSAFLCSWKCSGSLCLSSSLTNLVVPLASLTSPETPRRPLTLISVAWTALVTWTVWTLGCSSTRWMLLKHLPPPE